jgi:hypothetical protein
MIGSPSHNSCDLVDHQHAKCRLDAGEKALLEPRRKFPHGPEVQPSKRQEVLVDTEQETCLVGKIQVSGQTLSV